MASTVSGPLFYASGRRLVRQDEPDGQYLEWQNSGWETCQNFDPRWFDQIDEDVALNALTALVGALPLGRLRAKLHAVPKADQIVIPVQPRSRRESRSY